MSFTQEQFERLSSLMCDKGVIHEAFELLADLRQSELLAKQEVVAVTNSVVVALAGVTDFEGLPVSELNYLQVIRKLKEGTMKILDIPIGTKVRFKGTHGVCEEWAYGNCDKCILNDTPLCATMIVPCEAEYRADGKEVYFPEVKEATDD